MVQGHQQIYVKEKVSMDIVRLKRGGENFEVVLSDPDAALKLRGGADDVDISLILQAEHVYRDARKGDLASEPKVKEIFGTTDALEVAKRIIREGEFHLTAEQIRRIIDQKTEKIVDYIHMNALNPTTKLPHPKTRIKLAMDEAHLHIDIHRSIGSQLEEFVSKLRPIIPLSFEQVHLAIVIPSRYAGAYSKIKSNYDLINEKWNNDGSVRFELKIPAGTKIEIFNLINTATHGEASVEEMK